ncbi:MAG: CaiB/BaiF CoA transferase family protein [Gammaproteobacteria bacterium]
MPAPLSGIRVLDLSRILAGPWATQALADLGADVVKVERPDGGDDTRAWGPPYLRNAAGEETSEAAYYLSANRGKRSIAVDLAHADGQRVVRELALQSDVLVENFKVGALTKYGLAWEELRDAHPQLIYCSISAFGQDGPDAGKPGYDAMIQAMGGLMSITGPPDDEPGGGPQKVGVAVADLMAGMYAVTAILAALYERSASGRGQLIDLALLDTQLAWLANQNLNYLVSGRPPQRRGTAHPNIVPYQAFATADGFLMLAIGNDRQFASFCAAAGEAGVPRDERFATNAARVANRRTLVPQIAQWMRLKTTREWLAALNAASVPCGPINDIGQAFAEPQVRHRGLRIDLAHPLAGTVPLVANPINLSRTPLEYRLPPPLLGQHTDEVLSERLGYTADRIAKLRTVRAIG